MESERGDKEKEFVNLSRSPIRLVLEVDAVYYNETTVMVSAGWLGECDASSTTVSINSWYYA